MNFYVLTSELRVRLARHEAGLSPPVKYFTDRSKVLRLWIIYVLYVLYLLCLFARLFIDALWSTAGKGLTFWFSFVMSNCEFVTFPLVSWCWIASIPDLCPLSYFYNLPYRSKYSYYGRNYSSIRSGSVFAFSLDVSSNIIIWLQLTNISIAVFLWDIGKQCKTRSDTEKRGV